MNKVIGYLQKASLQADNNTDLPRILREQLNVYFSDRIDSIRRINDNLAGNGEEIEYLQKERSKAGNDKGLPEPLRTELWFYFNEKIDFIRRIETILTESN